MFSSKLSIIFLTAALSFVGCGNDPKTYNGAEVSLITVNEGDQFRISFYVPDKSNGECYVADKGDPQVISYEGTGESDVNIPDGDYDGHTYFTFTAVSAGATQVHVSCDYGPQETDITIIVESKN